MHQPPYSATAWPYVGPTFLPVLVLSAVGEERRDHVIVRQSRRDRSAIAVGLTAECILRGALELRGERVKVLDGTTIEWLAAPCGLAVRAILTKQLLVDETLAELEGPAYTVAWTALQRDDSARRSLLRGWTLTDPQATFLWRHMLASAHLEQDTTNDRAAVLWTILAEAGLHRDQLRSRGLQPRSACPDALIGLLLRGNAHHRRTSSRRRPRH